MSYMPGLEGIPATKSSVSEINGEKGILAYRGFPIETLARHSTYEETAWLLLEGSLPTAKQLEGFDQELRAQRQLDDSILQMMHHLPRAGHPMKMLQTAVAALGMINPNTACMSALSGSEQQQHIRRMAIKIIAQLPTLVASWEHIRKGSTPVVPRSDLTFAENFLYMFTGSEPDATLARILDTCLVLHAEHTINASTFAALVTGSTLASPDSVISAAVGTLSGPLHGGANQRVLEMLESIGCIENVVPWLEQRLAAKEIIWGMGHREYNVKDPRAKILQALVGTLAEEGGTSSESLLPIAIKLEQETEARLAAKGVYANVDFFSGILYAEMGFPTDQFTSLFAVSRAAGWLAHWREQLNDNRIFRPTQLYVGEAFREYVPVEQRADEH
ncbi:MAG: citrate synthase [Gammaproteobacteria bacterium]|nr:citrate synthase [Gammaproteobacteria bacterium]